MVLHSGDPHSWSNSLAHATFDDNVDLVGKDAALQLLREDIRSWIRERKGQSSQWSLYVRHGQMVTETGISLQEMTDNVTNGPHSDIVPENIKATAPLEAATLQEATALAVAGAERIVFPEQHLDTSGKVVSRYLSVWTRSKTDPTRYDGTRIDLGKNVHIEDIRTGVSFVAFGKNKSIAFHQHRDQKHAFVLEVRADGRKPFEAVERIIVTTIHRSHQEMYSLDHPLDISPKNKRERWARQELRHVPVERSDQREPISASIIQKNQHIDLLIDAPRAVVRDTVETVRDIVIFLRDKRKKQEAKNNVLGLPMMRGVRSLLGRNDLKEHRSEKSTERLTLEKIHEKPVRIREVIQKRHQKMRRTLRTLAVVVDTRVGIAAIPLLISALAKELPRKVQAVEKSIGRHERRKRRIKLKEVRIMGKRKEKKMMNGRKIFDRRSGKVATLQSEEKKRFQKTKEQSLKRVSETKRVPEPRKKKSKEQKTMRLRELARYKERKHRVTKKKERQNIYLERRVRKLDGGLWNTLARLARKLEKKQKILLPVTKLTFAWVLWLLQEPNSIRSRLDSLNNKKLQQTEMLLQKEPAQWILLSIIWYLAMIRESPRAGQKIYSTKRKKKKHAYTSIVPNQAIIFAYGS